uniref:Putative HAD-like domain-containing protein n=1 Tax=Helianthus annuus TaxID=4232 RepID=A0A251VA97_HELAN
MELFIGFNGGIPIDEDFFAQNISGKLDDDIATVLFPDDIERGLDYVKKKKNVLGRKSCAIKGLYKLTKWVEDPGLKRAAVTNSPRPNAELMIPTLGLTDFYHNHIIGDECEDAKPAPDPYLNALKLIRGFLNGPHPQYPPSLSLSHYPLSCNRSANLYRFCLFAAYRHSRRRCLPIGKHLCQPSPRPTPYTLMTSDPVSGIKTGVAAGMPVIGLTTRNPKHMLMKANSTSPSYG